MHTHKNTFYVCIFSYIKHTRQTNNIPFNAGMWKRKQKRLNFCGSTLKKEAGSGSELGNISLFEDPEAEAFFIKHGASASSNLAAIFEIKYNKKDS